jgi:hypothetical protein
MPVIEGKANFVKLKNTNDWQGKDTGTYSVLMTLNETDAKTFENMGVLVKPYGVPPDQVLQRKFKSKFPVKILDREGVDIRAVSEFILDKQRELVSENDAIEDGAAKEEATAAAVEEYGQNAVDLALADEIPSGVFRVSFKYGSNPHPVHGVPVYMDGIRILESEGVSGVDPAL